MLDPYTTSDKRGLVTSPPPHAFPEDVMAACYATVSGESTGLVMSAGPVINGHLIMRSFLVSV
jgi:hypothetical protein